MAGNEKALRLKALFDTSLSGLTRYVFAATFARMATGGAVVAVILLARTFGAEGSMAGLYAACLTAPHVFGPLYGRWLDNSQDPHRIIGLAAFTFVGAFQLAIYAFQWHQPWLIVSALLVCGTCSSFIMGGLSTQLVYLVEDDMAVRRRAQSWDTITYGFGLTTGPLLIAVLSQAYSVEVAASALMMLPLLAGLIVFSLPKPSHHEDQQQKDIPGLRQVVDIILRSGPLKRTISMTAAASFSIAALPVLSVYLSEVWQHSKEDGALLVTSYGVGCLCGAVMLMFRPLKAEALILLRNVGAILLLTIAFVALSHSFVMGIVAYWLCGVINSVFFAVTLAARTEYSPQQGAAQVYMWVAAAKISAASLGALLAGVLVESSIALPLIVSCTLLFAALAVCFWHRSPA